MRLADMEWVNTEIGGATKYAHFGPNGEHVVFWDDSYETKYGIYKDLPNPEDYSKVLNERLHDAYFADDDLTVQALIYYVLNGGEDAPG